MYGLWWSFLTSGDPMQVKNQFLSWEADRENSVTLNDRVIGHLPTNMSDKPGWGSSLTCFLKILYLTQQKTSVYIMIKNSRNQVSNINYLLLNRYLPCQAIDVLPANQGCGMHQDVCLSYLHAHAIGITVKYKASQPVLYSLARVTGSINFSSPKYWYLPASLYSITTQENIKK